MRSRAGTMPIGLFGLAVTSGRIHPCSVRRRPEAQPEAQSEASHDDEVEASTPAFKPEGKTRDDRTLLSHSVFLDPPNDEARAWAIDLALRCPAVRLVIADGRRLEMSVTRRLQLAAESRDDAMALIARPASERRMLSAAATRWSVAPSETRGAETRGAETRGAGTGRPTWTLALERDKTRGVNRKPICRGALG